MTEILILGGARLSETPETGVPQQAKRLALLAFLAIARPREGQRRDALVAMFWPDLDQDRARSALRQALHGLRRAVGPLAIVSDGVEVVSLDRSHVGCDVWELEAAIEKGDHDRVLALYHGPLLHGLYLSDAPSFEHWVDGERVRIAALVRTSAWAAAEVAVEAGASERTVECAALAASLNSLDESAVRHAMTLMARVGERGQALSLFDRFAGELSRELEVAPSIETMALAAELRLPGAVASLAAARPIAPTGAAAPIGAAAALAPRPRTRKRALVAASLALTAIAAAAQLAPRAATLDPRQVRVEPFRAVDDDSALAVFARALTRDAREALTGVDNVQVVATEIGDDALEMFDSSSLPVQDRAGTIVRGTLRAHGDSLDVNLEIIDRAQNVLISTVSTRVAPGNREALRDRLRASVAAALYPGWGTALSQPLTYESYRLLVDGLRSIKREAHTDALAAFLRAFAQDSSFTAAGVLAGMELYQMGRFAESDSIAKRITARREQLRPIDAHLLDWLNASLNGDRSAARDAMERVTTLTPTAELAWLQLAVDNVETARPAEALAALSRIDARTADNEVWPSYWATRIEALHLMRSHRQELAVARTALKRHPEVSVLLSYELRALAALGRASEVERSVKEIVALPDGRGIDVPATIRQAARELSAHGYPSEARRVLDNAIAWYNARPVSERSSVEWRSGFARTRYLMGDDASAMAIYDSIARERPSCFECAGALGVLRARAGDTSAARTVSTALAAVNRPFLFGRPLLWRARIAAATGDSTGASMLLSAAFAAGAEFDVMTHADGDLTLVDPEGVYRRFVRR